MKITEIITKKTSYKRRKVFKIAFTQSSYSYGVGVKIVTDNGIYGLGEAVPMPFVTGETVDGVLAAIEFMKPVLLGADPEDIEDIHNRMDRMINANSSAKAAIDIACYDIMGKHKGLAAHRLLGATENSLITDVTLGIDTPDKMAEEALFRLKQGFRFLKIKGGISAEDDLVAIKAIRDAVGDDIELRVDFNQGYTLQTAETVLKKLPDLGVVEAEQPLPAWDLEGMAQLKKVSPVPILIDEGVHSPRQAHIACQKEACDLVNIKLMKCGGIFPALQISDIAKSYGKKCIVGCMSESRIGISAGAAVVTAKKDNMDVVDLDSFLLFADGQDSVSGGFEVVGDKITLSEKSGYGFDTYEF